MEPQVPARPSATVMLLRDAEESIEVLMVRRHARGFFGGLTAFPGGAVDPVDRSALADTVVEGGGVDHEFRSAALRELAEETGLALTTRGVFPAPDARGVELFDELRRAGVGLDGEALTLVSRWVTPEEAPSRFDTRFYVARVGSTPEIRLAPDELVDHLWIEPKEALAGHDRGELRMFLPTISHLRWLSVRATADEAVAAAEGADGRTVIAPRRMEDGSIVPIHVPDDS
ncbi:MAG TPA: NUDIX domain-containing protein [Acidimicrobiia bacterium]|nr:NUDIX domain-containing protein [Acidimicrobiia bacterium]